MNDDWLHTGRLKEKVDQGNWEAKREPEEMNAPLYPWNQIDKDWVTLVFENFP